MNSVVETTVADSASAEAQLPFRVLEIRPEESKLVCVGADKFTPAMAINKEIDLRFVLGYSPLEFRDTLLMLAEGKVNAGPLVTGSVGLEGVEAAFSAPGDPDVHAKILVDPQSAAAAP